MPSHSELSRHLRGFRAVGSRILLYPRRERSRWRNYTPVGLEIKRLGETTLRTTMSIFWGQPTVVLSYVSTTAIASISMR